MIQMMLSMWYGAAVSIHASYRCLSQRHKAEDCGTVLYVALAVVFVGLAITLFTSTTWFLCSVDVTIREALTMDFMRFKVGPCFVWSKISRYKGLGFRSGAGYQSILLYAAMCIGHLCIDDTDQSSDVRHTAGKQTERKIFTEFWGATCSSSLFLLPSVRLRRYLL